MMPDIFEARERREARFRKLREKIQRTKEIEDAILDGMRRAGFPAATYDQMLSVRVALADAGYSIVKTRKKGKEN